MGGKKSSKKKLDFQKTKLKVGRKLPKGGNITDTSFKTKQIITPDQKIVAEADKSITDILKHFDTRNLVQKLDALKQIQNYVLEHKETLPTYFVYILYRLGNTAQESDPAVPKMTVKVIRTCLEHLTSLQYKFFNKQMILHMNCMMSHASQSVRQSSLMVMEALLDTHPKVVTQEPKLLINCLNMMSTVYLTQNGGQRRKLDDLVNNKVDSYTWHQEVLKVICRFLKVTMEPEDKEEEDSGENPREVYWDGKYELYLPLYSAGGPLKVDMSWYESITPKQSDGTFKKFALELLGLISDVLKGELPFTAKGSREIILSQTEVKYMGLVVNLLCYAVEFALKSLELDENEMQKLTKHAQDIVSQRLINGFPYAQHGNVIASKPGKEDHCIQLNLGICYLSSTLILDSDDDRMASAVINYLDSTLKANCDLNDRSLSLYLETAKILTKSQHVHLPFKNSLLLGICSLRDNYNPKTQSKMLFSFFKDLSFDDDYRELLPTEGMQSWFRSVGVELLSVAEPKGNRPFKRNAKLLPYVKQLCCRKYPQFMEYLNNVSISDFLMLLKYDDEDFQTTVIHMILALDVIPAALLNALSNLICQNDAITLKMSIKLIYQLHSRFSRPRVSLKEQLLFVKFLLNTACDTKAFREPVHDFEHEGLLNLMFTILAKNIYLIYPTRKWKTHQKIFKVCLDLLVPYRNSSNKYVGKSLLLFSQSLFNQYENKQDETDEQTIPVHTVLAYLLIRGKVGYMFEDDKVLNASFILMFSSFLYISVMESEAHDMAKLYCVPELQKCLLDTIDPREVSHLIQVNERIFSMLPLQEFRYALQVIVFLSRKFKYDLNNEFVNNFLMRMDSTVQRSDILMQVWRKMRY